MHEIPFNRPYEVGTEKTYISEAVQAAHLSSGGSFTERCDVWLRERTGTQRAVLTHSATAALEMAAMLLDVEPGDEVIMPSFTFVTTATAFVLRGAVPVFVDVGADTLNVDPARIEEAITPRTRAVVPVHYAGIACDMEAIGALARRHQLMVVEDAAQGLQATWRGRELGTIGDLGALSFHETKNVTCGEGGALLVNDAALIERAEILRDKGTNRSRFYRGEVDKYTWMDIGSSYGLSEINAAFLWGQFEGADDITARRRAIWHRYHDVLAAAETDGLVRRPVVPDGCEHNGHLYYLLLPTADARDAMLRALNERGINAVFHYVPLHSSPAGERYGRAGGPLPVTEDVSARLLRLPIWGGMSDADVARVADVTRELLGELVAPLAAS